MRLTLIGKDPDSNPTGSPTVYRTDRASWVVRGWAVTDPEALAQMDIPMARGAWKSQTGWPSSSDRQTVTSITDDEFDSLLSRFERDAIHLETRDAYGTATELPHMAKWETGEPDDLGWLQSWCATLREHVKAGSPCVALGLSPNRSVITSAGPTASPYR